MSDPCQPTDFLIPNMLAQTKRQIFLPDFLETVWISIGVNSNVVISCLPANSPEELDSAPCASKVSFSSVNYSIIEKEEPKETPFPAISHILDLHL